MPGAVASEAPAQQASARWLRAPEPEQRRRAADSRSATVGLDEVLEATSVEGLMRFSPARAAGQQGFALLPEIAAGRARAQGKPR
jgi:hypothetical protein